MESAVLDATAAVTAALSRRRKQSRPRQLASSVDDETSADNEQGTAGSSVIGRVAGIGKMRDVSVATGRI